MKVHDRCMACAKIVSNKRYYCYGCLTDLETKAKGENENE